MKFIQKRKLAEMPDGGDSPLNAAVSGRDQSVMGMVEHAIRHNDVMLAFQPVVQAAAPHGVAFYEGLIRVLDETGRVIPAREFISHIENTDLGRELDCAALESGLKMLRDFPSVRLSINMSARSIGYKRWMRILERNVVKDATLGERLMLEISEHSAMTVPELTIDFMKRLQVHGISFTLDDFGSGAMVFAYFRDFLFDAVKIDGQFIRNVNDDPDNQVLCRALVKIARELDMLIIAGRVETVQEADYLVSIGTDCLQGYLFGAPSVRPPWLPVLRKSAANGRRS